MAVIVHFVDGPVAGRLTKIDYATPYRYVFDAERNVHKYRRARTEDGIPQYEHVERVTAA